MDSHKQSYDEALKTYYPECYNLGYKRCPCYMGGQKSSKEETSFYVQNLNCTRRQGKRGAVFHILEDGFEDYLWPHKFLKRTAFSKQTQRLARSDRTKLRKRETGLVFEDWSPIRRHDTGPIFEDRKPGKQDSGLVFGDRKLWKREAGLVTPTKETKVHRLRDFYDNYTTSTPKRKPNSEVRINVSNLIKKIEALRMETS